MNLCKLLLKMYYFKIIIKKNIKYVLDKNYLITDTKCIGKRAFCLIMEIDLFEK